MGDRYLYRLQSKADETASGGFDMEKEQYSQIYCPECGGIRPEWKPRPINVVLKDIECPMITCIIRGADITKIFQKDLIETVRRHFACQIVGQCHVEVDGAPDYVTCYSTRTIFVRGGKGEGYWICPVCGKHSRDRLKRPDNVLRRDLDDSLVFQDAYQRMYFRQALVDEIEWSKFRDAELEKIRIVDRPLDGKRLPGDPDWDAM